MSEEKLLDAFGQIEEEFIEEAEPKKKKTGIEKKEYSKWITWIASAACVVLIVGIGAPLAWNIFIGSATKGVEKAENEAGTPEAIQEDDLSGITGEHEALAGEATDGSEKLWMAHFNEVTDVLDSARKYIPGYFTEELSVEEIAAIEPEKRQEWMRYSGCAGFDGEGNLIDVSLMVTTTIPENPITVYISENGTGRCYVLPRDAVVSVCKDVEYKVSQWDNEESTVLVADTEMNGYSYSFTLTSSHRDLNQAKEDFTRTLECFAYYADGKPDLSAITTDVIPEWFDKDLTYREALEDSDYGAYMIPAIPEGFTTESIRRYKDQDFDYLSGLWTKGYDELNWKAYTISEADENRLTSVNETKNYDLSLYPIPRASSVPKKLREVVDNPIFYAEELTQEAVWARVYTTGEAGDSDGWRMAFSVKYGEKVVEIRAKGVDPEWVYQQLVTLYRK